MPSLLISPQKGPLTGIVSVPGDKSISHRAVMLGALASGTSKIMGWLPAGDTIATLDAVQALGVEIRLNKPSTLGWDLMIEAKGLHGLRAPRESLDCRNAGTCMRLLAGILAGQPFPSILDGSDQLRRRPMGRIVAPLGLMGAHIEAVNNRAPLHIHPAELAGIEYELPVASAQVKSAILLAGLYAIGETRIFQPGPARDHTERMLEAMGAPVTEEGNWISLLWPQTPRVLKPLELAVPGDPSSAAFILVAAACVPHSQVTITGVGQNSTRTGLQDLLVRMGASIQADNVRTTGGEPVADLTVRFDELHGLVVGGAEVVRAIDEFPIWAVAASQAAGPSRLQDAAELRVKEVDRISLVATELRKMAASVTEHADGFTIDGPTRLRGAEVDSHGDHRLGMALAVAGLIASGKTIVHQAECISDSFPGFVETLQLLGAQVQWLA